MNSEQKYVQLHLDGFKSFKKRNEETAFRDYCEQQLNFGRIMFFNFNYRMEQENIKDNFALIHWIVCHRDEKKDDLKNICRKVRWFKHELFEFMETKEFTEEKALVMLVEFLEELELDTDKIINDFSEEVEDTDFMEEVEFYFQDLFNCYLDDIVEDVPKTGFPHQPMSA